MHYQLMDVATGDILAADVVTYDPPAAALVAAFHEAHIIPDTEPDRLGEVIYPRVATVLANKVLNIIAPLQILKVVGTDSIYVSGGKGRLAVGDTLAVTTGTTVVNPQTDAVMKADHVTGAELEVTQVGMGYAVAKLMQGKPGDVRNGSQLQKLVDQLPPAAAIYPMTPGSSEAPVHWN
jgi:hypothetical protein